MKSLGKNSKEDNDLMTVGLDLGIYIFTKMIMDDVIPFDKRAVELMNFAVANQLEGMTGIPAEDLALKTQNTIDFVKEKMKPNEN